LAFAVWRGILAAGLFGLAFLVAHKNASVARGLRGLRVDSNRRSSLLNAERVERENDMFRDPKGAWIDELAALFLAIWLLFAALIVLLAH
jgi:hypothetical protein